MFDTRSLTVTIGFANGNFAAEQASESWTFSGVPYGKLHDGRDCLSDGLAAIGSSNHLAFYVLNFHCVFFSY